MYPKNNALKQLFPIEKPIIGMVHLLPLPGTPFGRNCDLNRVYDQAIEEALILERGGVDGIIIENDGDIPFLKPELIGLETTAFMSVIGDRLGRAVKLPFGFNVLGNAAKASFACAKASGAQFIRVNQWVNAYVANEGLVEGAAAEALRYRNMIEADAIPVFADVHVKHGSHAIVGDREISEQARDVEFFGGDVLIATGSRTGHATATAEIEAIKAGTSRPVIIGSGLTAEAVGTLMRVADGAIVGSSLKTTGDMTGIVVLEKVQVLMDRMHALRARGGG